jgi:hypothetical protein
MPATFPDISYPIEPEQDTGPVVLKAQSPASVSFSFLLLFTLIWNGIVSVFLVTAISGRGQNPWLALTPTLPFVAIGLALIVGTLYVFLSLFNPKLVVVISHQVCSPGQEFEISWMFEGSTSRIHRVRVWIEGEETATYRSGTTDRTDRHVFYRSECVDTTDLGQIASGAQWVHLPVGIMHSFHTPGSTIQYHCRLRGYIAWWPDIDQSYEISVVPPPIEGQADQSSEQLENTDD